MNAKESRKREKTKNVWDKLKTKSKIVDLNPSTSININGQKSETWKNFKEFSSPYPVLSLDLV